MPRTLLLNIKQAAAVKASLLASHSCADELRLVFNKTSELDFIVVFWKKGYSISIREVKNARVQRAEPYADIAAFILAYNA